MATLRPTRPLAAAGVMLVPRGDLFGLLNILDIAESDSEQIRRDCLFATSPQGIIIELSGGCKRERSRSRSGGRVGKRRKVGEMGKTSCSTEISSISSSAGDELSTSTSPSTSTSTSTSRRTSFSTSISTCTCTSKPEFSIPSKTHPHQRSHSPKLQPNPRSKFLQKAATLSSARSPIAPFTYHSPTTHKTTTINPSHPEDVPSSVANEAVTALIGTLDNILASKRGLILRPVSVC